MTPGDPEAVLTRLRERLAPLAAQPTPPPGLRPAAVLVPFVPLDGVVHLLFLRRPETMREHSGQIAFPGGRLEPGESWAEAALREAHEELGIPTDAVQLLGESPGVTTTSGYWLTPVVGWLPTPPTLHPNPAEVAESFYVPLSALLGPRAYDGTPIHFQGRDEVVDYFHYHHPELGERIIWGATGRVLRRLFERVFAWAPPRPLDTPPRSR